MPAADTWELRRDVLRPHQQPDEMVLADDDDPSTASFAALDDGCRTGIPHPEAFADHAAEFYSGSGNDCRRALELARVNVANRPTRRAVKQAQAVAMKCP